MVDTATDKVREYSPDKVEELAGKGRSKAVAGSKKPRSGDVQSRTKAAGKKVAQRASAKKKAAPKKAAPKKAALKKAAPKKAAPKKAAPKKAAPKKAAPKKAAPKKAASRKAATRKATTGKTVPKKAASGKKATSGKLTVKKPAQKKTVGKKSSVKKTTTRKVAATRRGAKSRQIQPASPEVPVTSSLAKAASGKRTATTARLIRPSDPVAVDGETADVNSLSWMASQAVKTLNAVKASQAEKAQAEMLGVETDTRSGATPGAKPTRPAVKSNTTGTARDQDKDKHVAATESAAAEPVTPPVAADKKVAEKPAAATLAANMPATNADAPSPAAAYAETRAVTTMPTGVSSASNSRSVPTRPIMAGVFFILLAVFLGYRYWHNVPDTGQDAAIADRQIQDRYRQPSETGMARPAISTVMSQAAQDSTQAAQPVASAQVPAAAAAVQEGAVTRRTIAGVATPGPASVNPAGQQDTLPVLADESAATATPAKPESAQSMPVRMAEQPPPAVSQGVPGETVAKPAGIQRPRYPGPGYGYYPQPPAWYGPGQPLDRFPVSPSPANRHTYR